jgi:UDP-glucose 4-epimerase
MPFKILVTGCSGYIGATFTYEALKLGHKVLGIDNFSNSSKEVIEKLKLGNEELFLFEEIELHQNSTKLNILLERFNPDFVVHFAALKSVNDSTKLPAVYWRNNLLSTLNLVDAMIKSGCRKLIFSSSAVIYGNSKIQPVKEDFAFTFNTPYANTKIAIEKYLQDISLSGCLDVVSLRYFNPVGSHSSYLIYEDPRGAPNNLMPRIIRVALGLDQEISIYGNDYKTRDGTGERDYIHVDDLIKGHILSIEYLHHKEGFTPINLGTGNKHSVLELIHAFEKVNNISVNYRYDDRRDGDIPISYADPGFALHELSWKPAKSLEDMCGDSWQAIHSNKLDFPGINLK